MKFLKYDLIACSGSSRYILVSLYDVKQSHDLVKQSQALINAGQPQVLDDDEKPQSQPQLALEVLRNDLFQIVLKQ